MFTEVLLAVYIGSPLDFAKYRHTALHFRFADGERTTMHIKGAHGFFEFERITEYKPEESKGLAKLIPVATIPDTVSRASITTAIYLTPMRNGRDDGDWNCQNWVGDALARLVANGYISVAQRDAAIDEMIEVCLEAKDE